MKTLKLIAIIPLVFCIILTCSKDKPLADSDPLSVIQRMKTASSLDQVLPCYTEGTGRIVKNILAGTNISEGVLFARLAPLGSGVEWQCLRRDIKDDRAQCEILITGHPVENRAGASMTLNMRMVDGKWRIDMEDELSASLKDYRRGRVGDYVEKKFRGY